MPVTPSTVDLLHDPKLLQRFLVNCHRTVLEKGQSQLLSLSLPLSSVDPLRVLQRMHRESSSAPDNGQNCYFYLEKNAAAIAAWDPVWQVQVEGTQRFIQTRQSIRTVLANILTAGDLNLPFAGPHFFCSFTFFDQNPQPAPFAAATIFLPRWQISRSSLQSSLVANLVLHPDTEPLELATSLWQDLQRFSLDTPTAKPEPTPTQPVAASPPLSQTVGEQTAGLESFRTAVTAALEGIHTDRFCKLVLAHALDIDASPAPDVFHTLTRLRSHYPNCYVFSHSQGRGQTFLGASPERLIRLQGEDLIVDALAGSAPRGASPLEDEEIADRLLHSPKDLWEHQINVDFICQALEALEISPQPQPPGLLQLPNIQHLQTLITAKVPAHLHLLDILAALHPTPAVAGSPRVIACDYIRRYEPFERSLYAAPLGWIDYQGNGEFIVGIRSALISDHSTRLYAGAGIVAGSAPDQEVAEIQLKLQTLLSTLY